VLNTNRPSCDRSRKRKKIKRRRSRSEAHARRTPDGVIAVRPMKDGVIADFDVT